MAPLTTTTSSISGSVKILVLETDIQPLVGSDKGDIGKAFQELFSRVGKMRTPLLPVSVTSHYVVGNMSDSDAPYGGELPTIDALLEYHGILITGSKYCAHGDAPWILNLMTWLKGALPPVKPAAVQRVNRQQRHGLHTRISASQASASGTKSSAAY